MRKLVAAVSLTALCVALVPAAFGQDGTKKKTATKKALSMEVIKAAAFKATITTPSGGATGLTGKHEGKPCATDNASTSTSRESTSVQCTIGGVATTCNCQMDCTNTCENKVFSTDCTLDLTSCTVNAVGGSGGGTTQVQVQGAF